MDPKSSTARAASTELVEYLEAKAVRVRRLFVLMERAYPQAECALLHNDPLELLVATILSAQCTDKRVNLVTRELFAKYRSAVDYAIVPHAELAKDIRSTGFFNAKARHIQGAVEALLRDHDGQVPDTMAELVALPGVGRKTASVVLGVAFDKAEGVVVDTHVTRLSRRLGLSTQKDPNKIERNLMELLPQDLWIAWSHMVILHGRQVCTARKPRCEACALVGECPKVGVVP